jgi:hypothetical protein
MSAKTCAANTPNTPGPKIPCRHNPQPNENLRGRDFACLKIKIWACPRIGASPLGVGCSAISHAVAHSDTVTKPNHAFATASLAASPPHADVRRLRTWGMGFQNPNIPMPHGIRKNHPTQIRKFNQIESGSPESMYKRLFFYHLTIFRLNLLQNSIKNMNFGL